MKKILKSIKEMIFVLTQSIVILMLLTMCAAMESNASNNIEFDIGKHAKFMRPMKLMANGRNYCSSTSVNHKGQVMTVTNVHCCNAEGLAVKGDERRVGDSIEKIIHMSITADVCILTSSQKNTIIKLAKREFKAFDRLAVIGYPWGMYKSFSEGVFLHKEQVCYRKGTPYLPRCIESNIITAEGYPGNSGSAILNTKGRITNVLYCGSNRLPNHPCTVRHKDLKLALDVGYLWMLDAKK